MQMSFPLLKISGVFGAALLLACGIVMMRAEGQTTAPMLGEIAGDDVSVLGPSNIVEENVPREIAFGGGSTIVVHSGKAHVEFAGGGELEICGPAKFTVLASGEALTIALSFGRVHARLNSSRPITIYSPLIVATPMAIGNQPRDMTIGLMNTGAMCILAARGAVQVQQQLSGETLVVPQPSEVLLQGTSVGAMRAASGSCRCDFDESSAQEPASSAPAAGLPQAPHELAPSPLRPSTQEAGKTSRTAGVDSATSQTLPPAQPAVVKKSEPTEQATSRTATSPISTAKQPVATIDLLPISYDAGSAATTAEPLSVATFLLAKAAVVQPEWIFRGTVAETPRPAKSVRAAAAPQQAGAIPPKQQSKGRTKKKGFWARLHDFFSGSPRKSDCVGEGCG